MARASIALTHPMDAHMCCRASLCTRPVCVGNICAHLHLFMSYRQPKEKSFPDFSESFFISPDNISIRIAKWNNIFFSREPVGICCRITHANAFFS